MASSSQIHIGHIFQDSAYISICSNSRYSVSFLLNFFFLFSQLPLSPRGFASMSQLCPRTLSCQPINEPLWTYSVKTESRWPSRSPLSHTPSAVLLFPSFRLSLFAFSPAHPAATSSCPCCFGMTVGLQVRDGNWLLHQKRSALISAAVLEARVGGQLRGI